MKRRRFLGRIPVGLGALAMLPGALRQHEDRLDRLAEDVSAAATPEALWRRVRQEFQLRPGLIHLNSGTLGATPRLVIDAVASTMRQIEGNPAGQQFGWGGEQMEQVRARAATFLGAGPDEVALTRNTTEAMNAVATGIDLGPGDQVLTTNHEHGGGMVCWQHLRKHRGIEIVYIPMPIPVRSRQQILELVRDHLSPRTRVCSFSHIDTITGVRMPLAEVAEVTRPREILLVCDGAQAPGMLDVDLAALRVDTYACSGHKWLLAPKGTGLLYVRKEVQERVQPALLYDGYAGYTASSGTRDVAGAVGLGVTMQFHEAIGRQRIVARWRELSRYLRASLEGVSGLRILTPAATELSGAILTCALERGDAGEIVSRMRREHEVMLKRAQSTYAYSVEEGLPRASYNAIRFSTHIFNDEPEIDRSVDLLNREMARA